MPAETARLIENDEWPEKKERLFSCGDRVRSQSDGTTSLTSKAVAILSSTPSPLLRQWTNHLGLEVVKPYQPKVALPPSVRVIQDVGGFYGKGSVALRDLTTLLRRAANYLRETGAENPAVITHKVMREQVASKHYSRFAKLPNTLYKLYERINQ